VTRDGFFDLFNRVFDEAVKCYVGDKRLIVRVIG
jgi:hypothetical protein